MKTNKLSFEQMENLEGGGACQVTLFVVGGALGLAVAVSTSGTAAVAGWALATYIGGLSFFCPQSSTVPFDPTNPVTMPRKGGSNLYPI